MKKIINKFKRGFTIVELVVVIAVIAILAAVLIPTLSNVLNSAEESADMQTVYHLNQILLSYSTVGDGAETISEAIEQADENGYNVSKLTPTSDGDILWDSESNRFLLVSSSGEVLYSDSTTDIDEITSGTIYPNLWKIVSSSSEVTSYYSIYYSANYSGTLTTLAISNVGVDVSAYTANTVNISYTGNNGTTAADNIVIIGNGGTLTLDDEDEKDEIKFYGIASTVTATSVASASLHIHGTVKGRIEIEKGHLVLESSSNVNSVYVTNTSAVTVQNSSSNSVIVGSSDGNVTVTGNSVTQTKATAAATYFDGGFGTEDSPYLISTSTQFKNIYTISANASTYGYNSENKVYYKLTDDITLDQEIIFSSSICTYGGNIIYGVLDGDNHTVTAETVFSGYSSYTHYLFYQVKNSEIKNLTVAMGGKTRCLAYYLCGVSTYTNVDVTGTVYFPSGNYALYGQYTYGTITLNDCISYATITGLGDSTGYDAVFIAYNSVYKENGWDLTLTFNNCVNAGSIVCGKAAMFIGNLCGANAINLTINNCKNTGIIRSTYEATGYTPNYYIASGSVTSYLKREVKDDDENVIATYESYGSFTVDGVDCLENDIPALNNTYNGPTDSSLSIYTTEEGYYAITGSSISGASYYVISIGLYATLYEGGTTRYYVRVYVTAEQLADNSYISALTNLQFMDLATYIELSGDTNLSNVTSVDNGLTTVQQSYTSEATDSSYYTIEYNGTTYYLVNSEESYFTSGYGSATLFSVSAYDESGNLLSSASMN